MQIKRMITPTRLIHSISRGGGQMYMKPTFITIHETDNTGRGAGAYNHALLQYNGNPRVANWHYSVDSKDIYQSVEDTFCAPHAGSFNGNANSIGIELCVNSDGNFAKTKENGAWLVATLMKRHGIPINKVVQHSYWSGKNCPRNLRISGWNAFIQRVLSYYKGGTSSSSVPENPAKEISGTIGEGKFVKVKEGKIAYANANGKLVPDWVKKNTYKVKKIEKGNALLSDINSWIAVKDLALVEEKKAKQIGVATILSEYLNVRDYPDFEKSKVIKKVYKGNSYKVYEEKNGFYNVGGHQWISAHSSYTSLRRI